MLRYVDEQGLRLGDLLSVVERQPFGGPVTISVDGHEHVFGGALVHAIRVAA